MRATDQGPLRRPRVRPCAATGGALTPRGAEPKQVAWCNDQCDAWPSERVGCDLCRAGACRSFHRARFGGWFPAAERAGASPRQRLPMALREYCAEQLPERQRAGASATPTPASAARIRSTVPEGSGWQGEPQLRDRAWTRAGLPCSVSASDSPLRPWACTGRLDLREGPLDRHGGLPRAGARARSPARRHKMARVCQRRTPARGAADPTCPGRLSAGMAGVPVLHPPPRGKRLLRLPDRRRDLQQGARLPPRAVTRRSARPTAPGGEP